MELSHACVLRRCWELTGDGRIHQFGIRSGDREEFRWGKDHVETRKFDFEGLEETLDRLKGKPVYFTLDLDVLDPSVFPGTGTPEPGGVSFEELRKAAELVCRKADVAACDVNELSPPYDPSGISTAAACKIVREMLIAPAEERRVNHGKSVSYRLRRSGFCSHPQNAVRTVRCFRRSAIASRTKSKCDALKEKLEGTTKTKITTRQVDADKVEELIALIEEQKPDVVLNLALPYQDLTIMDACLATKTNYVDTANYEPEDTAKFEYSWQWAYRERFEQAGITALLGSGFDPGVTGVFSAYALKHQFDEIHYIDILDCNGGDHGYPFATNFNPEINIREVSANGSYWEDGHWVETQTHGDQAGLQF